MKNKKRNIKLNVINLICITAITLSGFSIYHKQSNRVTKSDYDNIQKQINDKEIETVSYRYAIETEGDVDEKLVSYVDLRLQVVPQSLLETYFNNNGKIIITDKDISKIYYKKENIGHITGLHDARNNIIYISNSSYAVDNSIVHEFGHVLDSLCEWDSMNDDFSEIYNVEKETLKVKSIDEHHKVNQREFFAQVFQEYILHSDICKSTAPKAYEFVKNKIENFDKQKANI